MKTKLLSLLLLSSFISLAPPIRAQSGIPAAATVAPPPATNVASVTFGEPPQNPPPATPQGFLSSVQDYFTSFSTLTTFTTNNTIDLWTGYEYVSGESSAVCIGVSYNTPVMLGPFRLGVESVTRNAPGLAGTAIYSEDVGVNLQLVPGGHDVKVVGFLDGGYDWHVKSMGATVGARFFKALSDNTFAGIGIAERITSHTSNTPTVSVFAGVKF